MFMPYPMSDEMRVFSKAYVQRHLNYSRLVALAWQPRLTEKVGNI